MKNKSIELIGISGSGKSYTEQEIRIATKNYIRILNRREIIINFIHKFLDLTIKEKLTIYYFNLLNIFKKKPIKQTTIRKKSSKIKNFNFSLGNFFRKNYIGNFFRKNYTSLCKKIFNLYCLKNKKFKKQLDILINNLEYMEKEYILFWFYELCAARYIFEKTRDQNYVFLNDEGFIPKSFLFFYTKFKLKDKKKRILKYLETISYPDSGILLYKNKEDIFKTHENRKKYNIQLFLNKKILIDIFKINKDIEKYLNTRTKVIRIKNNHKILEKLIRIIKSDV